MESRSWPGVKTPLGNEESDDSMSASVIVPE